MDEQHGLSQSLPDDRHRSEAGLNQLLHAGNVISTGTLKGRGSRTDSPLP